MASFLENFRKYLHRQAIDLLTIEKCLVATKKFFSWQGVNTDTLSFENINDILMLQSVFNERILRQYQAGFGVNDKTFFALFKLGKFLVSQSFLSENPAEKVLKIPAESPEYQNYFLRELAEVQNSSSSGDKTLIRGIFRPAFTFLFLILIFTFNWWWRGFKPAVSNKKMFLMILRLEVAKPVFAETKIKDLEILNNLSDNQKIVSSSAEKVTRD